MKTLLLKLWGDFIATPGRYLMMVVAIALCSAALTAMLFAHKVLTREMHDNYLATHPAAANLYINESASEEQLLTALNRVKENTLISEAEIGEKIYFKVEVAPKEFVSALIFITQDPSNVRISKARLDKGYWPAEGEILLERKALTVAKAAMGDKLIVSGQNGLHPLKISGLAHDPALAPADTEHIIYGYMSSKSFQFLNEPQTSRYIKITLNTLDLNREAIESVTSKIAQDISDSVQVTEIHIPPPDQHPHQIQMLTGLKMLLLFSSLTLVLGALLIATTVWGILAQQVRQIGIMKTLGASSTQIASLYLILVSALGILAFSMGFPFGVTVGRTLINLTANLLNLEIFDYSMPNSLWIVTAAFCIGLPALLAFPPIQFSANKCVLRALNNFSVSDIKPRSSTPKTSNFMPIIGTLIARSMSRRPSRLFLTLFLLAIAGSTFIASQNLLSTWNNLADSAHKERPYQIEMSLLNGQWSEKIGPLLASQHEIAAIEFIQKESTSVVRENGLIIKEAYPDGGHGNLSLIRLPLHSVTQATVPQSGHWFTSTDEVVVNRAAYKQFFSTHKLGDEIFLHTQNQSKKNTLVGIREESLAGASIYSLITPKIENGLRIQLKNAENANLEEIAAQIKQRLEISGIPVKGVVTEKMRKKSAQGHLMIMVLILVMIAAVMCTVGLFSLATVMSTNVSERLREIAVMRSLGADNASLFFLVVGEALLIAALSFLLTLPLSALFSIAMTKNLSAISSQPLSLSFSINGFGMWLVVLLLGAFLASLIPALRAMRFSLREALTFL